MKRASEHLYISQPSISRQIQTMEEELGVQLLNRTARGVVSTEAGQLLFTQTQSILSQVEELQVKVRSESLEPSGPVTLGLLSILSSVLSVPLVERVLAKAPKVSLRIVESMSGYIRVKLIECTVGDTIGDEKMKDLHPIFSQLKNEFPKVYEKHMQLGREIHLESGPLDEKTRWLIKIAISAATGHKRSFETHLAKSQAAGVTDEQISHALLLLVPNFGFPAFMEAYSTSKEEK